MNLLLDIMKLFEEHIINSNYYISRNIVKLILKSETKSLIQKQVGTSYTSVNHLKSDVLFAASKINNTIIYFYKLSVIFFVLFI